MVYTRSRSAHRYDSTIFERHLDLSLLRGRRRGLVRCRFHDDDSASLSLDLDAGVFHCFGCGQQGGVKRFAALVGEMDAYAEHPTSEEPTAWLCAMRLVQRQPWFRPGVSEIYAISDFVRRERQRIARLRRTATEDDWDVLGSVATAERFVDWVEAELDDLLRGWNL